MLSKKVNSLLKNYKNRYEYNFLFKNVRFEVYQNQFCVVSFNIRVKVRKLSVFLVDFLKCFDF